MLNEALDVVDVLSCHRLQLGGGRHRAVKLLTNEKSGSRSGLQPWDIAIEIHPIDALKLIGDVIVDDIGDVFLYHDHGVPG